MSLVERLRSELGSRALQVAGFLLPSGQPAKKSPSAAFMRGGASPVFSRWNPALRDASDDVKSAWRLATARTVDSFHNSGWLAGAAESSTASVVGPNGLKLNAKPNADALGWTQGEANQWARRVEARFSIWAESARACDAGARYSFAQLLAIAYRHSMATGEELATLPFFFRPGSAWGTKLRILPAWRMSSKSEGDDLIQGVRVNATGAPVSYVLKERAGFRGEIEREWRATDSFGRPLVVHIFDGEPDQVRGIPAYTPALKVTRQFDQLADATLTAALIQAVFAAIFESSAPGDDALAALQSGSEQNRSMINMLTQKADWYNSTDVDLGIGGKIVHSFPGDELKFLRSEHPNATYEPFARFLLREMSRTAAVTYEDFTGDFSGATFSSIKMGTAVVWPKVVYRRRYISAPLAQRAYEAWLEEDIESGGTPFPGGVEGFLRNREALAQANWRGPTMPQADELKAAQAARQWQAAGVPDEIIFDALGLDVDDVYEQRKREQDRREALELKDRPLVFTKSESVSTAIAADTPPDEGPDDDPDDEPGIDPDEDEDSDA